MNAPTPTPAPTRTPTPIPIPTPARGLRPAAVVAIAVAVAGALTAPLAFAAPGETVPTRAVAQQSDHRTSLSDDFNGDGYRDVVTSTRRATVSGKREAGHVTVLYGAKSKFLGTKRQFLHQDIAGVPDTAEEVDHFGEATTTEDLDRDGYADLIVGTPREEPAGTENTADHGSLSIFWGGKKGLSPKASVISGQSRSALLGAHLAAGDFNGDKIADLVTVDGGNLRTYFGPFTRDGSPAGTAVDTDHSPDDTRDLAVGDYNGDGVDDVVAAQSLPDAWYDRTLRVWQGARDKGLVAGGALKKVPDADTVDLGDVNGDGFDDIVYGRQGGDDSDVVTPKAKGGLFVYVPGSKKGPATSKAKVYNQDSAGVPGKAVWGDGFGEHIAVGDVDGDSFADIAVGAPGEDYDGRKDAGAVVVLRGYKGGISTSGGKVFTPEVREVPGVAQSKDAFGAPGHLVDFNDDGRADLVTSATEKDKGKGAVWAFKGSASGITPNGSMYVTPEVLGIPEAAKGYFGLRFNN
ncbi:FG-GAP and VCBS repeat-containing protein [Streptomyces katsurahamanus]|uniref:VCBS repeat-containing protein n=1 Tax=Streptomyces katsurahamanus TaxID=2577098 RepID=A0ABW9NPR8_9ACTN|nr:FG-GAP and VCBS repeat-containing protein [Streptomyces katsurahamanus]MQS35297.1 hypothetical protein [Streptomyces katsurahamanus]